MEVSNDDVAGSRKARFRFSDPRERFDRLWADSP